MAGRPKGLPKTGGRKKGARNKLTVALKDAILEAGNNAGGEEGLVGYLTAQAVSKPSSFLALLGRLLPLTAAGDKSNPLNMNAGVTHVYYTRESAPGVKEDPAPVRMPKTVLGSP
jgi:hypothetical protein